MLGANMKPKLNTNFGRVIGSQFLMRLNYGQDQLKTKLKT